MKAWTLDQSKTYFTFIPSNIDYYGVLGVFRILVTLIALIDFTVLYVDLGLFLSSEAVLPWELGLLETEYYYFLAPLHKLVLSSGITFNTWAFMLSISYFVVLGLCLIGFKKYLSFSIAIILQIILFRSIPNFNYGYDHFITMTFFYCLLFPVDQRFSLANRASQAASKDQFFTLTRFLKTHLGIIYLTSGLAKAVDPNWWNGNAIWRSVATLNEFMYVSPYIFMILSISTVILELSYPILTRTRLKKMAVVSIILMHLGIGIFIELSSFAAIMIIWNLTAFYKCFTVPSADESKD